MADVVSPEKRSEMMSGIRSKNTKPEIVIRKALHKEGFRFRIHCRDLPGKPDLVFPKYKAVIFIHGCFWHVHDCSLFKWPSSRREFWKNKLSRNQEKDIESLQELRDEGWRAMVVWECAFKGVKRIPLEKIVAGAVRFLTGKKKFAEIKGKK